MSTKKSQSSSQTLNADQRDVLAAARLGCDRATAARCVGWSPEELASQLHRDAAFRRELERAEAVLEIGHLRNVQTAAHDEKNWRASVWWLERRLPERYARPKSKASSPPSDWWVEAVSSAIAELVTDAEQRARLAERIDKIAAKRHD